MEINSYLAAIRRRLWILIVVPLLAVAVVVAWDLRQPPEYQATATIAAPAVVGGSTTNQYSGANAPRAFVADFSAAVTSPLIVDQVAKETGASPTAVRDGLSATQIGESSLVQLTYVTPRRDQAMPVVSAAAGATIRFLFQTQVTLAEKTAGEAREAVDRINDELSAFYKKTGQVLPDEAYRIKAEQVSDLQREQASAQAIGETTRAGLLGTAIESKQDELAALAPQVAAYQALTERRTQALGRLNVLEEGLERAQAQFSAADPESVVVVGELEQASQLRDVVTTAVAALGAGLFLAVGIVLLLELGSRRSRGDLGQQPASAASAREYVRSQP
jgi:capsular polysaccharide biosynthesis protein